MKFPFINTQTRIVIYALAVLTSLLAFDLFVIGTTSLRAATMIIIYSTALYLHVSVMIKNKEWKDLWFAAFMMAIQIPAPLFGTACWTAFIGIELIVLGLLLVNMTMSPSHKPAETIKKGM